MSLFVMAALFIQSLLRARKVPSALGAVNASPEGRLEGRGGTRRWNSHTVALDVVAYQRRIFTQTRHQTPHPRQYEVGSHVVEDNVASVQHSDGYVADSRELRGRQPPVHFPYPSLASDLLHRTQEIVETATQRRHAFGVDERYAGQRTGRICDVVRVGVPLDDFEVARRLRQVGQHCLRYLVVL